MTTEHLYEFLILSKTLHYGRAAEILYLTESTLSKHIAEMEKELGLPLFERDSHSVRLTPAGLLLSGRAYRLIRHSDETVNLLQIGKDTVSGTIRLAVSVEFSQAYHVRTFIRRFRQRYPDILLQTEVISTSITPACLDRCDLLLAPCSFPELSDPLRCVLLQRHPTYVVVGPTHEFIPRSFVRLRELEGQTLLVPFSEELFGPYAQHLVLARKLLREKISYLSMPNLSTALLEVSLGRGIAIVPRYVRHIADSSLGFIPLNHQECTFPEYLYCRHREENTAADLFCEEFAAALTRAGVPSGDSPEGTEFLSDEI